MDNCSRGGDSLRDANATFGKPTDNCEHAVDLTRGGDKSRHANATFGKPTAMHRAVETRHVMPTQHLETQGAESDNLGP